MKTILIILAIALGSCSKYCDPANITNGKSLRHHDRKQMKAQVRIKYTQQIGPYCVVHAENMKMTGVTVCECDCKSFPVGQWVAIN